MWADRPYPKLLPRPSHAAIDWSTESRDRSGWRVLVRCPSCGQGGGAQVAGVVQRLLRGTFTGRCVDCGLKSRKYA